MTEESMSLESLLQIVQEDVSVSTLLDGLWEKNSALPKLLFAHRNQLFPRSQDKPQIELKLLFWDNCMPILSPQTSVIAVAERMGKIQRDLSTRTFGVTYDQFLRDIEDLIAYYLIRFVRDNDEIRQLVMTEDFSFGKMKEVLKDYSTISATIGTLFGELSNLESMNDKTVKSKVKKIADLRWLAETLTGLLSFPIDVVNPLQTLPFWGHPVKEALIATQGLTYDEYTWAINFMYASNAFARSQSILWCENCRDERLIFSSTSKLDPHHANLPCPKCGRKLFAAIAYHPKETLMRCILFKDGILAVALAYLLRKEGTEFRFSHYNKHETDFICKGKKETFLVECKMHRTDVNERGVRENLKKDLKQLIAHANEEKIKKCWMVLNYPCSKIDEIRERVLTVGAYKKTDLELSILSYEEVPELIRKMNR